MLTSPCVLQDLLKELKPAALPAAGSADALPPGSTPRLPRRGVCAGGLGASVMLDYAYYRPEHEIDIELRYTHMHLEPILGSDAIDASSVRLQKRVASLVGVVTQPSHSARFRVKVLRRPLFGDGRRAETLAEDLARNDVPSHGR